jgi:hypothetical protein
LNSEDERAGCGALKNAKQRALETLFHAQASLKDKQSPGIKLVGALNGGA